MIAKFRFDLIEKFSSRCPALPKSNFVRIDGNVGDEFLNLLLRNPEG